MNKVIECLLCILETPFSEKVYAELKKVYESLNKKDEAEAIDYLIQRRFHVNNDVHSGKE